MAHASGIANPDSKNVVNETAKKEEIITKSGKEGGGLVDAEVNRGPHAGSGSAHGGPNKLQEIEVSPCKRVVQHDQRHRFLDSFKGETGRQSAFPVQFVSM